MELRIIAAHRMEMVFLWAPFGSVLLCSFVCFVSFVIIGHGMSLKSGRRAYFLFICGWRLTGRRGKHYLYICVNAVSVF